MPDVTLYILTSDYNIFSIFIEEQDTNTGVDLQKTSTRWLTNASIQCSQNQVTYLHSLAQSQVPKVRSVQLIKQMSKHAEVSYDGSYLSQRFYLQAVRLLLCTRGQAQAKHSGEKPFKCSHCNFSCTTAGNLKTHKLTHSGDNLSLVYNATFLAHKLAT